MENTEKINKLFSSELSVVNVGLEGFHNAIEDQGVKSTQLEWKPPAGGNAKLLEILAKLNR